MKKIKWILFAAVALSIAAIMILSIADENASLPNVSVLSDEEYAAILSAQAETDPLVSAGQLLLDGAAAPYGSGKYLLSETESLNHLLSRLQWSKRGRKAYLVPESELYDFMGAVSAGHVFHLLVTNGRKYFTERVVVTSLPVLILEDDAKLKYKTGSTDDCAMMRLFTPEGDTVESICSYRLRGGSSLRHPKQSYRVTLYGGRHRKQALSLLGMRESKDWILLPLYTDRSRMREKVALDLWNTLAASNPAHDVAGSSFEYVEVIRGGIYSGLHGLVTPLDEIQCGVSGNSDARLYKVIEYMWEYVRENYLLDRRALSEVIELKYPASKAADSSAWEPMYRYVDAALIDGADTAALSALMDEQNLIDHALYLAVCSAVDNTFKNVYYLWRADASGEYRFTKIPWDLNYTFGDTHDSGSELRTAFSEEMITRVIRPDDLDMLTSGDGGEALLARIAARYAELRETVFDTDRLIGAFEKQQSLLLRSGVYVREGERWGSSELSADLDEINRFITEHMAVLDEYYGYSA